MSNWIEYALCSGMDTNIFYPEPGKGITPELKLAVSTCKKCPVRTECLMHAMNTSESFGVWGGVTYRNRLKIAKNYSVPISYSNAREAIQNHDDNL